MFSQSRRRPLQGPSPGWRVNLHCAKWVLTPLWLDVKLGGQRNYHKGRAALRIYANQRVNTHLLFCLNSVLNVKVLEGAFNHEKGRLIVCSSSLDTTRDIMIHDRGLVPSGSFNCEHAGCRLANLFKRHINCPPQCPHLPALILAVSQRFQLIAARTLHDWRGRKGPVIVPPQSHQCWPGLWWLPGRGLVLISVYLRPSILTAE